MMNKFLIIGMLLLVAACSGIKPVHYYQLHNQNSEQSIHENTSKAQQKLGTIALGIRAVKLPSMLKRKGIVSNKSSNNITIASHHVWAGRLGENLTKVLAESMADKLGTTHIVTKPWNTSFRPEFQLEFDIHQFSGELNGIVWLKASWVLSDNYGQSRLLGNTHNLSIQTKSNSYSDYVLALNTLIQILCQQSSTEILMNADLFQL